MVTSVLQQVWLKYCFQGQDGAVHSLPAIPDEGKSGSVKGNLCSWWFYGGHKMGSRNTHFCGYHFS